MNHIFFRVLKVVVPLMLVLTVSRIPAGAQNQLTTSIFLPPDHSQWLNQKSFYPPLSGDPIRIYAPIIMRSYRMISNHIVYSSGYSSTKQRYELFVMNPDGTEQTSILSSSTVSYAQPVWSPDGLSIAYVVIERQASGVINNIYILNPDGTSRLLTNFSGHHYRPAWSPDGSKIAFSSDMLNPGADSYNDIYVMNADGTDTPLNLTNTTDAHDDHPTWSPDGNKIAFSANPASGRYQILVKNADGSGAVTNLTQSSYGNYAPDWSPDGQKIVFYRNIGTNSSPNYQIFVMNADGTGQTQLTFTGQNKNPNWSADGTQIIFNGSTDAYDDIYIMFANGTGITNITNHANSFASRDPDWK